MTETSRLDLIVKNVRVVRPNKQGVELLDLGIYDANGKAIRFLSKSEKYSKGNHAIVWDGKDETGIRIPAGVYFYRVSAGNEVISGKMINTD